MLLFQVEYSSMLYSLLTNSGVEVLGGILFFVSAIFILKDKLICEKESTRKNYDFSVFKPYL